MHESSAKAETGTVGIAPLGNLTHPVEGTTPLPRPCGYKLLVALPVVSEATEGGIMLTENTKNEERVASIVGKVVGMGPEAYKGTRGGEPRFPLGPYCKLGDWVLMRAYSGTRFLVDGIEYRMLDDDSIEGLCDGPEGVTKI